jgi:hypothetical protein
MKSIFSVTAFLLFISQFTFSQNPLKYAETITRQDLKTQLIIIASSEMEGRETGTAGQRKAAAYIESQFEQSGLKAPEALNGYLQYYPLMKDTLIPGSFKINKRKLEYGKDYVLLSGDSKKEDFKSKQIVFAGYGIQDKNYDDYAGKDVKDKVVIILSGEPKIDNKYIVSGTEKPSVWSRTTIRKTSIARQKGATAVLFINTSWDSIPSVTVQNSTKSTLSLPGPDQAAKITIALMPSFVLNDILGKNDASKILDLAKQNTVLNDTHIGRAAKIKLNLKKSTTTVYASNVIGLVEGSDKKDEYVFLTAHYDHLGKRGDVIYHGADDDGSGTATVIEMAEAFAQAKKDGYGPRRTVVFMTVSGEEKGLWGSSYYTDFPVFPLDKTTVDLNTDMIGRIDPDRKYGDSTNYVYVIGDDKLSSDLTPISKAVNEKYTKLELDYKYNAPDDPERIFYRSDHYNFAKKGVPIIFFSSGLHKDYHQPSDTVDKINFDIMEKRARFIFLTAWEMANRDAMLKRDIPLPELVR